jgi:hypothetical protein
MSYLLVDIENTGESILNPQLHLHPLRWLLNLLRLDLRSLDSSFHFDWRLTGAVLHEAVVPAKQGSGKFGGPLRSEASHF